MGLRQWIEYGAYWLGSRVRGESPDDFEFWQLDGEYLRWLVEGDEGLDLGWLCRCGHWQDDGLHCECCGGEPPWGCDCGFCNEPDDDGWLDSWANYPGSLLAGDLEFEVT